MVRFAPRYGIISPCMARPVRPRHLRAVNDNETARAGRQGLIDLSPGATLDSALRLFAAHGFSAAARARDAAVIAEANGDAERGAFWLEVCGTLDRRMARDMRALRRW